MPRPILRLGPFVLLEPFGQGAMGTVYHAFHEESGAKVAVKVVRPDAASDPLALSNLASEIRAVAALDHPNIVQIYDVGLVSPTEAAAVPDRLIGGTPWFAMEVAEHGSLKRRLRALDGGDLVACLVALLDALAHAHARGILHLDMKPANVLYGARIDGPILSDFGMGVVGDPDPAGDFVRGTPHFMAPELVRGRWEEIGPWTDLYALGNLAWVAATGRPPMPDDSPQEILASQLVREPGEFEPVVELPPGFESWVRLLLAKDPARRPRFAADAQRALLEAIGRSAAPRLPRDWRISEDEAAAEVNQATGLGLALRRDPPLVGRTRERTVLWEALRRAADGHPQVVVVRGPRGSGKSRLARWLGVRAHELGSAVFLPARGGPHGALHAAIKRAFPVDLRDWDAQSGLTTRLIERGLAPDAAANVAAWLAHGRLPPSVRPGADAPLGLVCDALRAEAEDRPLVVAIDEVQESPEVVRFLTHLLESHERLSVVFVVTAEDEALSDAMEADLARLDTLPGASCLELGPLSEQARHALARRMLPLDPSLASEVAGKSAGNPGFAVHLVQDLAGRRVLQPSRYGLTLPPGVPLSVPPGLAQASESHLEPLLRAHPEWVDPLRVAAALGAVVDEGRWRSACERLGVPLVAGIAEGLEEVHLWGREPNGWRFLFPAMVESLASGIEEPHVHRACAEVLAESDLLQAGVEWQRAGESALALDAWLEGARRTSGAGLLPLLGRIREVAEDVLAPSDPRVLDVAAMAAECSIALGWLGDAKDAAERMLAHADEGPDRQRARLFLAAVAVEEQDGDRLRELLETIGAIGIPTTGHPELDPWRVSALYRQLGDIERARHWVGQAGDVAAAELERLQVALLTGTAPDALVERTHRLGEARDRPVRAAAAAFEGWLWYYLEDAEASLHCHRAARRRYRALGAHSEERLSRIGLLVALGRLKDDEALRLLDGERLRPGNARIEVALGAAEAVLRLPRPRDLRYSAAWAGFERAVVRGRMLDAGHEHLLRIASARADRPDRTAAIEDLLGRHRATLEPRRSR